VNRADGAVTEIPVAPETPKPPAPRPRPKPKPKPKLEPKAPELKLEVPESPPLVPQMSPKQPHAFLILKPLVPKAHTVEVKPLELKQKSEATRDCAVVERSKSSQGRSEAQSGCRQSCAGHSECRIEQSADRRLWRPKRNRRTGKSEPPRQHQPGRLARFCPVVPATATAPQAAQGLRARWLRMAPGVAAAAAASALASVVILYKPNPVYSAEGRERKIQGDVVLEVIFLASGQMKVTRVVSGLGFGMDDEAIHAAQRIRFTPAMRDGKPVDLSRPRPHRVPPRVRGTRVE